MKMDKIKTVDPLEKENLKLRTELMCLGNINQDLSKDYGGLKKRKEIISHLKYLTNRKEEKENNLKYFEEGQIAALKWILGFKENTKIEEIIGVD